MQKKNAEDSLNNTKKLLFILQCESQQTMSEQA